MIGPVRLTWAVFFLVLLSASCAYSADVVFIRAAGGPSTEQEQLEAATKFYGLNLQVIMARSASDDLAIRGAVEREETVGVAISANALGAVNKEALLQVLHHRQGGSAPVFIVGVAPDTDTNLLRSWSGSTALGCKGTENPSASQYVFGRVDSLTWQLADLEVPVSTRDALYLVPGENKAAQLISGVRHENQVSPVFIEAVVQQAKVFVTCAAPSGENLADGDDTVDAFLRVAPAMIFVRYCAGERGWHALHQYANLTIDDPWLRQPYGYVDYEGLFREMERHGFHTTIAFIPWNYDRSEPGVVSLFRNHPERFSISIHGDNHDHKEFTDYQSKPLAGQIADLKQSLARMERFQALTGIPHDNVMIFPHSIAPEKTLEALKTYNYLATVNSTNVPQGAAKPKGLTFALRPVTLSFAGFPSISRYSVAGPISKPYIAINEFLGNPLLFYGHSDDFAKGIDGFDSVADEVNKLEPDTQWRSLGDVIRHQYVVKLRSDSNYDVLSFSSSICLDNVSGRDSIFYVRKEETGPQAINSLTVDGQRYEYRLQDGSVNFSLPVPAGKTRFAVIQYENDFNLASVATSNDSSVVYFLRKSSDFRDIYLSKSAAGLAFIRFYNEHEISPAKLLAFLAGFMMIFIFAGYRLSVFVMSRRYARPAVPRNIPPAGTIDSIR